GVDLHGVGAGEVEVGTRGELGEGRPEPAIELDRVDVGRRICEPPGQHPLAGADLEDDVAGVELGVADDRVEQVRVGEEVLAEPDQNRTYQPKRVRALASTTRSSSS